MRGGRASALTRLPALAAAAFVALLALARPAAAGPGAPAPQEAPLMLREVPEALAPVVREIVVTGAKMVEEATVRARIGSREGAPYDAEQTSRDVRALFELGSFEDIKVDAESFEGGVRLTYLLTERPLMRAVEFEGNKEVSTDDLKEKAALPLNAPYNPVTVAGAVARMRALYREKGFYQAALRTSVEPAGVGQVRLKVVAEEGQKYKLLEVTLPGVKSVPEDKLRAQLKTAPWTVFSWLTGSGKLQTEVLQEDRQRIVSFYQDRGYLDVRVGEPVVVVDDAKQVVRVTIPVTEGAQFRLGATSLQGDDLVPLPEIRRLIGLQEGDVFRRSAFSQGLAAVNQRYASRGFAFVSVDYTTKLDPETRTIAVTFVVNRGAEARIGRITVSGNVTTRDKVIRRELTFREGDIFNSDALRRSRQKVQNLGFFEAVDLVPRPRENSVIDVDIEVKEKLTGQISFGLGYSSEDQLTGQLRLQESNLFGRGHNLALVLEKSPVRGNYSISFTEPSLFDGPWSFGFSIYNMLREYDEYDREAIGGRISVGRSVGEYVRANVALKHETVTVDNIELTASDYIREQEGTTLTNSVRVSMVRDTRDNFMNPTNGNRDSVAAEYAGGFLQGDNDYTRFELEHSSYVPLFWKVVGMAHGEYGRIKPFNGDTVLMDNKYFLGGIMSLRGFPYREVGPKDENGDPIGGTQQLFFNFEMILPIAPEQGFNVVAFYDTGNAWDEGQSVDLSEMRQSAGFGIRWMSPIGPFRLEWGYILDRQEGEPSSDWSFIIGNFF
jgi:outer membrane protein insertion porin family